MVRQGKPSPGQRASRSRVASPGGKRVPGGSYLPGWHLPSVTARARPSPAVGRRETPPSARPSPSGWERSLRRRREQGRALPAAPGSCLRRGDVSLRCRPALPWRSRDGWSSWSGVCGSWRRSWLGRRAGGGRRGPASRA